MVCGISLQKTPGGVGWLVGSTIFQFFHALLGCAKRVADRTSRSAVAKPAFFLGGQHFRISPRSVFQRIILWT